MALTPSERDAVLRISKSLGGAFVAAGNPLLFSFANDPAISPLALPLGIIDAHGKGLASAFSTLEESLRARLIRRLPQFVDAVIAEGERS